MSLDNYDDISNIYVCMGSFKYDEKKNRVVVYDDSYSWREYMGLEQSSGDNYEHVLKNECKQFEDEHIVLHPEPNVDTMEFYQNVRRYYLNNMVKSGPDEAFESTKQKYYK